MPDGFGTHGPPDVLGGSGVKAHGPNGMIFAMGRQSAMVAQSSFEAKTFGWLVTMRGCGFGQPVQMIEFVALTT
jgi:hypothetical protein